ncbi:MAG: sulfatase [Acidobacteriia bacterium]|nr:sulfatase [Terriglobia bacterium]
MIGSAGFKKMTEGYKSIGILSLWMGLVFGSLEGILLFALTTPHIPESVYVSVLVDVPLFLLAGLLLQLLRLLFKPRPHFWIVLIILCVVGVRFGAGIAFPFRPWIPLYLGIAGVTAVLVALAFFISLERVQRFQKRSWPWIAGFILLWTFGFPAYSRFAEWRATRNLPAAVSGTPNVVLIIADTLAADHLSLYGYHRHTDPNLTRFAQEGTVFQNAISASSWTLPSHVSMLTGRMQYEHGVDLPKKTFGNRFPTLGEAFLQHGYRTAGFDANPMFFLKRQGFGRGFLHFEDASSLFLTVIQNTYYGSRIVKLWQNRKARRDILGRLTAEDMNSRILKWIDRKGPPFLMVVNFFDAHDPYFPREPFTHKYLKSKEPQGLTSQTFNSFPTLSPQQVQDEMDSYDASIEYLDAYFGALWKALEQRGLDKNTLIVFTADHGETFNVHGFMHHGNALYLDQIHVPLIFWWPGKISGGVRVDRPVSTAALPATILNLVDPHASKLFPGLPLDLLGEKNSEEQAGMYPLSELAGWKVFPHFPNYYGPLKTIVTPQWQYIESVRFGKELFAWPDDPQEQNNLSTTPEGQSISAQLGRELHDRVSRLAPPR